MNRKLSFKNLKHHIVDTSFYTFLQRVHELCSETTRTHLEGIKDSLTTLRIRKYVRRNIPCCTKELTDKPIKQLGSSLQGLEMSKNILANGGETAKKQDNKTVTEHKRMDNKGDGSRIVVSNTEKHSTSESQLDKSKEPSAKEVN